MMPFYPHFWIYFLSAQEQLGFIPANANDFWGCLQHYMLQLDTGMAWHFHLPRGSLCLAEEPQKWAARAGHGYTHHQVQCSFNNAMSKKGKRWNVWVHQGNDLNPLIFPGPPSDVIALGQLGKERLCMEGGNVSGQHTFRLPVNPSANALACRHTNQDGEDETQPTSICSLHVFYPGLEHRERSSLAGFLLWGFSSWAGGAQLLLAT